MDISVPETLNRKGIEIFCCYAYEDQQWLLKLRTHLAPLQREGLITLWDDTDINPGDEWRKEISRHLETAQIILLLVSPNFIASDYCYKVEVPRAMEQHERGEARVIPIILHSVSWKKAPFGKLQALPAHARPVTSGYWHHPNEAFYSVVEGIRKVSGVRKLGDRVPPPAEQVPYPSRVQPQRHSYHLLHHCAWLSTVFIMLLWLFTSYQLGIKTNLYSSCLFRNNSYYAVIGAMDHVFCLSYSSGSVPQVDIKASKRGEAGLIAGYEMGNRPLNERVLLLLLGYTVNSS